jgi:hypothetical protein
MWQILGALNVPVGKTTLGIFSLLGEFLMEEVNAEQRLLFTVKRPLC